MKVVQICIGRFHHFDLAREMFARGALGRIFTGYPRWKLRAEGLPQEKIETFPWVQAVYMALVKSRLRHAIFEQRLAHISHVTLSQYVARRIGECDVLVALSGNGLEAGREVRRRGGRFVCDRGSSHIRYQDGILKEEFQRWGVRYFGIYPRSMEREEAEYAEADMITVPSEFARASFVKQGIPKHKVVKIPYGVDLRKFAQVSKPDEGEFHILFVGQMSLRKGIPYLLEAYRQFRHPRKSLTMIGPLQPEILPFLKKLGSSIQVLGPLPQSELKFWMSRSHVLVLPSIEEGLALVQAQAMACGCPVIATTNTGAEDLFEDGKEGRIVPIRNVELLLQCMDELAANPTHRDEMSTACLNRVRSLGGSSQYGAKYMEALIACCGLR